MSFKQFLLELPDDVTPEQAQHKYDDYRAEFWGSEVPPITPSGHVQSGRLSAPRMCNIQNLCCWSLCLHDKSPYASVTRTANIAASWSLPV